MSRRDTWKQFLELQEAYSVLSDPKRRVIYDREAEEIPIRRTDLARPKETVIGRRHSAEPLTPVQPVGFEEISLLRSFETFFPSFSEMFDRLRSNFELVSRPKAERLESLAVDVTLSPQEAFVGGQMRILVPARVICPACRGRGSVGPYQCWRCEGHGALTDEYPVTVSYPAGLQQDYIVRLPLDRFGIENFYLTVRSDPPKRYGKCREREIPGGQIRGGTCGVNCSHVFFFTRAGGEAYLQDLPKAEMHRLEAGLALAGTSSQQLGRRI